MAASSALSLSVQFQHEGLTHQLTKAALSSPRRAPAAQCSVNSGTRSSAGLWPQHARAKQIGVLNSRARPSWVEIQQPHSRTGTFKLTNSLSGTPHDLSLSLPCPSPMGTSDHRRCTVLVACAGKSDADSRTAETSSTDKDKAAPPSKADSVGPTAESTPLVKLAWYASEAFGKAVSGFRQPGNGGTGAAATSAVDAEGATSKLSREEAVKALREDYDKSYFVTGDMTMDLYEKDCEFADPFVSFRGRDRFKQNVSNLGSFMEEVNLKIVDWQEDEGKLTTKWRFSCVLGLPWRPILAASGGTDHFFDKDSGRIFKHVERWDISPTDGLRQLIKPNPRLGKQKS